jgi:hypothetical protein
MLVGAVGIELKATLKARKLLILLNEKNDKNIEFTQVRYTPGTRRRRPLGLGYGLGYSSSESLVTFGLEKYPRSLCIASMCFWF